MVRTLTFFLLGLLSFLFACEIALRLLPVSTSTETGYYNGQTILTNPPHHRWTMSTGWDLRNAQTLSSNNVGFSALHDFEYNPQAIALIGDSYVEASMLTKQDRPDAQLERALQSRPVYAMGSPGTSLLDYAERIRFAHKQYGIRDFVVLMQSEDIRQALCGSGNVNKVCLNSGTWQFEEVTVPPPGRIKRVLRQSALSQYLISQLKIDPVRFATTSMQKIGALISVAASKASIPHIAPPLSESTGIVSKISNQFFEQIAAHVPGRLIIAIDTNRQKIYKPSDHAPDAERLQFIQTAKAAGAIVVDAEPIFKAHVAQSSLRLEVGPYDGHLNPMAIRMLLVQVADKLR